MQERIFLLRKWQDAQASLLGKMLLKTGLTHHFNLSGNVLDSLELNKYNKPVLANQNINFNISHSSQFVICAIAYGAKIGIDVERIRPVVVDDFLREFTGQELANIHRSSNKYTAFFNYWTKKEAVLKAEGVGLYIPLSQISLGLHGDEAELFSHKWYLNKINFDKKYCSWLASDNKVEPTSIELKPVEFD